MRLFCHFFAVRGWDENPLDLLGRFAHRSVINWGGPKILYTDCDLFRNISSISEIYSRVVQTYWSILFYKPQAWCSGSWHHLRHDSSNQLHLRRSTNKLLQRPDCLLPPEAGLFATWSRWLSWIMYSCTFHPVHECCFNVFTSKSCCCTILISFAW